MSLTPKEGSILIVDDNPHILESLGLLLKHDFRQVMTLENPDKVVPLVLQEDFDLILLDMNFSSAARDGQEGLFWLQRIIREAPQAKIVLITAFGGVELAVQGMKLGAADFILKPWNPEKLVTNLRNLVHLRQSEQKLSRYRSHIQSDMGKMVSSEAIHSCRSESMQSLFHNVGKVAPTDANILITGENGTGKELIARMLHNLSLRKAEIFAGVDVGSLSESIFESELFGHLKGSFTGAHQDKQGRIAIADGGTLFMDEIGNISPAMQARLLSVLEKKEVIPVGGTRPVKVDVRIIAATNANIVQMVQQGGFREDLYYRLNTIVLHVPALRERPEDIEGFGHFFLEQYKRKYHKPGLVFSTRALQRLKAHSWPGNVRELRHTIEKAVILCDDTVLRPEDLLLRTTTAVSQSPLLNLQEMERHAIVQSLEHHQGNLSHASRQLGITRATLYAKMKKYGL
ncbi:MAG: sigma-54 dependent transcriptional regulator [Bacteroidales bacterium]